ncbi:Putative L-lactate dehydrogenase operon regulatory protein [Variovorax sp. SRS16]|uniref:FadR/GntR family transcriptional regulator n=1 Tax=Variovorax sp. SRS16 TaxID=282217 RepID=UPI0013188E87|nr:FadR/GntR family transcriptional regulator [Variovorax sp. SRS16]VTU13198.1 Putative L-lactate dehydrogenase operon regulatory protein [Variovorax sp. SRS16]
MAPTRIDNSNARPDPDATLADRVTDLIAADIRGRAYPVNTRLPSEQSMTEQYGVSRTVVREAIARLRSEGLVETRQGSGTVVRDPKGADAFRLGLEPADTQKDPAQGVLRILELRRGIEAEMAALAAQRRTAGEMAQIQQALRAIASAVKGGGDGVEEDLAFHIAISRAAHNTHYTELLGLLTRALHDAIRLTRTNEARRADLAAQVLAEHEAICAAIRMRDAPAARTAAFLHMHNTAIRIEQADKEFWTRDSRAAARRLDRASLSDTHERLQLKKGRRA